MPNTYKKLSKTKKWYRTTSKKQLTPLVPAGLDIYYSITWFLDKSKPFLWGALTRNIRNKSYHIQLFRTKKEREHYWDGTDSQWDVHTRFFRFKNTIKIDKQGKWWIYK